MTYQQIDDGTFTISRGNRNLNRSEILATVGGKVSKRLEDIKSPIKGGYVSISTSEFLHLSENSTTINFIKDEQKWEASNRRTKAEGINPNGDQYVYFPLLNLSGYSLVLYGRLLEEGFLDRLATIGNKKFEIAVIKSLLAPARDEDENLAAAEKLLEKFIVTLDELEGNSTVIVGIDSVDDDDSIFEYRYQAVIKWYNTAKSERAGASIGTSIITIDFIVKNGPYMKGNRLIPVNRQGKVVRTTTKGKFAERIFSNPDVIMNVTGIKISDKGKITGVKIVRKFLGLGQPSVTKWDEFAAEGLDRMADEGTIGSDEVDDYFTVLQGKFPAITTNNKEDYDKAVTQLVNQDAELSEYDEAIKAGILGIYKGFYGTLKRESRLK